ncbi:MAG: hypothetical protein PHH60_00880, partial [Candidatus Margulisbacteria bacterium]|nr:hypothetical protein [Candidatus Margulisiibacteriota bacterium]
MKKKYWLLAIVLLWLATGMAYGIGIAADPTRLGVGARPLGMGKAFIGLADDAGALFLNPAGLGGMRDLAATTMTGKFINEVDY